MFCALSRLEKKVPCFASCRVAVLVVFVGVMGLVLLYCWNPLDVAFLPKCPFFAFTGYKCPGCGTLRGIHSLLHLNFRDAVQYNLFMVMAIPLFSVVCVCKGIRCSVVAVRVILGLTLLWWVMRNLF